MSERRFSFHFPEEAAPHVFAIQRRTWLKGAANVIRAAISAIHDLTELTSADYMLFLISPTGEESVYSPHCPSRRGPPSSTVSASSEPTERLAKSFFFPADVAAKIEAIRTQSHAGNKTDVIRMALAAFDDLTDLVMAGSKVVIRGSGEFERNYNPFAPLPRADFCRLPAQITPFRPPTAVEDRTAEAGVAGLG
jgi:hypothetical protein